MAKSRATLASDITTNLADNTSGDITPEILRTQLQDMVDSAPNITDEPPVSSVAGRTGAVTLTKSDVGLGSVDNTADTAKPVSTLQAVADSAVASAAAGDATTKANAAQAAAIAAAASDATTKANAAAAASVPTSYLDTDGTLAANSDSKVATQKAVKTALALKADSSSLGNAATKNVGTTTGTVAAGDDSRITGAVPSTRTVAGHALSGDVTVSKSDVGLGSVDNTADTAKPVSTAQQTALNLKADLASPTFTGTPLAPTAAANTNTTQLATTAHVYAERSNAATLTNKRITQRVNTVAYGATVTPDSDSYDIYNIGALTGGITLGAPTGTPTDGQTLRLRFLQDGTGGRSSNFNAAYAFGTDVTAALIPTTANAKYELLFQWNATDSKWRAVGIVRGF